MAIVPNIRWAWGGAMLASGAVTPEEGPIDAGLTNETALDEGNDELAGADGVSAKGVGAS
jgi:hypothetical protein